jgi:predicted RNA-binding Zn-ribbon protein involved in translation (DUF1610 family)
VSLTDDIEEFTKLEKPPPCAHRGLEPHTERPFGAGPKGHFGSSSHFGSSLTGTGRTVAPADAEFCPECGAKLVVLCAECGTANAPAHRFCKKCGQRLGATAAHSPEATRFASPVSYMPKHLAQQILSSKTALEGERKQVTMLFADLKGSMELLADRIPKRPESFSIRSWNA